MPQRLLVLFVLSLLLSAHPALSASQEPPPATIPVPGMVTLVDLGAGRCIPCKLMAPILREVKAEYQGRAAVIFVDVWEDSSQVERFGIRAIPTQIFYDAAGRETVRHEGFMDKAAIVRELARLGVK